MTEAKDTKPKGWSNPALRMMGIPTIRLPSRNWMIFWSVLASIGSGIAYDKYQQNQIRKKYVSMVEHLGQEVYTKERIPRKLTIFIAPPPNDFLEESLRHFKKFVKPILNAAAIDYEIYTENRQGDIRAQVAEKIRQLRRERSGQVEEEVAAKVNPVDSMKLFFKKEEEGETYKSRSELYDTKDVLGLYHVFNTFEPKRDDELDYSKSGGVLCIGRGTYKEYMTGVHEGLLGPLKPEEKTEKKPETSEPLEIPGQTETPDLAEQTEKLAEISEEKPEIQQPEASDDEEADEKLEPVPKPYIRPEQYASATLAPELDFSTTVLNNKKVPVLFEQPVYAYPVRNLLGFFNTPQKIYRFFTKRRVAEDYGHRTLAIVYNLQRDFQYKDQFMAKEEELDWPKKWVQKGHEKQSEWVQELAIDERIAQRMRVYDHDLVDKFEDTKKSVDQAK